MGFDHLPENVRHICEGKRTDLDPQVVSQFKRYCEQNDSERIEPQSSLSADPVPSVGKKSWLILGLNFSSSMIRWSACGFAVRSKKEIKRIFAICKACPEFQEGNFCGKCNCRCVETGFLVNKIAVKTETCPLNKWS